MFGKLRRLADPHRRREAVATVRLFGMLVWQRIICWLTHRDLVIVVLLELLGDIVACQPVAAYLRSQHPRSRLIWICKPKYKDLLRFDPDVDIVATVPCLMSWMRLRKWRFGDRQVNLNIRGRGCADCGGCGDDESLDPAVTFENFLSSGGLLPAFCRAAGLPPLSDGPRLYFPSVIWRKIERWKLPKQYVVLHCSSLDPAKDWGPEKWKKLGQAIEENFGLTLVEIGLNSALERSGYRGLVNMCAQTTMVEAAAIIQRATLFIGGDSGPAHLANAVKCPGVILLGEYGAFKEYVPYTGFFAKDGATIVRAQGPVSSLSVDEVLDAIRNRMRNSASRPLAANLEDRPLQSVVSL